MRKYTYIYWADGICLKNDNGNNGRSGRKIARAAAPPTIYKSVFAETPSSDGLYIYIFFFGRSIIRDSLSLVLSIVTR